MPRFSDSLESYQITLWPLNLLCFQSLAADCPRLYVRGSQTINGVCSRYYYLEGQMFIRREKCCRFYRFILFNISIHAILRFLCCLSFAPFGLPILPLFLSTIVSNSINRSRFLSKHNEELLYKYSNIFVT